MGALSLFFCGYGENPAGTVGEYSTDRDRLLRDNNFKFLYCHCRYFLLYTFHFLLLITKILFQALFVLPLLIAVNRFQLSAIQQAA